MAVDTYYSNVTLLLHCNGTDASTTFTDNSSSPLSVTANGNAQVDTAISKFGGASALFDGTGDYLLLPNNAGVNNFGTGDFCMECWIYPTSLAANRTILSCYSAWTTSVAYDAIVTSAGTVLFRAGNSIPVNISSSAGVISTDTWYHVAFVCSSNVYSIYVNGTQSGTTYTGSTSISNSSQPRIGMSADGSAGWVGQIDDIRFTKGVPRYTTNFTAPTEEFPDVGPSTDRYVKYPKDNISIYTPVPIFHLYL